MRKLLLTSAAVVGLAFAGPGFAQTAGGATGPANENAAPAPSPHQMMRQGAMNPATGARYGHVPGRGVSLPMGAQASNITAGDTRSIIAPTLPSPPLGPNATPDQFLSVARRAISMNRTGEAQEALERAETRRLDYDGIRNVSPGDDPMVGRIRAALDDLANHRLDAADQAIAEAMRMGGGGGTAGYAPMGPPGGRPYHRGQAYRPTGGPGAPPGGAPEAYGAPGGTETSGMYQSGAGNPHRTSEPGTLGTEVTPPGTPMNPTGSPQ